MTVIQVSQREFSRLRIMVDVSDGRLTVAAAGELMGVGRRQVFRLCRAFKPPVHRDCCPRSAAGRATAAMARPSGAR